MKKNNLKKVLSKFYEASTVNAIARGDRRPSYEMIIKLHEDFNIPFTAWKDIKSFINESITSSETKNKYRKEV